MYIVYNVFTCNITIFYFMRCIKENFQDNNVNTHMTSCCKILTGSIQLKRKTNIEVINKHRNMFVVIYRVWFLKDYNLGIFVNTEMTFISQSVSQSINQQLLPCQVCET